MKKWVLIISLIILIAVIFFFPKKSGFGGSALDVKDQVCRCFGFETMKTAIGPWESTCYGIPHSCQIDTN